MWIHPNSGSSIGTLGCMGTWGRETDAFLTELFLLSLLTLQQKLQIALQGVVHLNLISSFHVNTTLILKNKENGKKSSVLFSAFCLLGFPSARQHTPVCTEVVNLTSPRSSKHSHTDSQHILVSPRMGSLFLTVLLLLIINSFNEVVLRPCSRQQESTKATVCHVYIPCSAKKFS